MALESTTAIRRYLCSRNASVSLGDVLGETPLHRACLGGHTECARLLLDARASVDAPPAGPRLRLVRRRGETSYVAGPSPMEAARKALDAACSAFNVEVMMLHIP